MSSRPLTLVLGTLALLVSAPVDRRRRAHATVEGGRRGAVRPRRRRCAGVPRAGEDDPSLDVPVHGSDERRHLPDHDGRRRPTRRQHDDEHPHGHRPAADELRRRQPGHVGVRRRRLRRVPRDSAEPHLRRRDPGPGRPRLAGLLDRLRHASGHGRRHGSGGRRVRPRAVEQAQHGLPPRARERHRLAGADDRRPGHQGSRLPAPGRVVARAARLRRDRHHHGLRRVRLVLEPRAEPDQLAAHQLRRRSRSS